MIKTLTEFALHVDIGTRFFEQTTTSPLLGHSTPTAYSE